jgi:hypothetical protein
MEARMLLRDEAIKENFCKAKPAGRLIPMLINVNQTEQLADLLSIVSFKKCFYLKKI